MGSPTCPCRSARIIAKSPGWSSRGEKRVAGGGWRVAGEETRAPRGLDATPAIPEMSSVVNPLFPSLPTLHPPPSTLHDLLSALGGPEAAGDLVPVDGVPPGGDVVGAAVLVLQVVGVLPD